MEANDIAPGILNLDLKYLDPREYPVKRIVLLSSCLVFMSTVPALSAGQATPSKSTDMSQMDTKSMNKMDQSAGEKSASTHTGTGVVKSVDAAAGSVTLAHEPIKSLNWPAMTMAFKVKDKKLLDDAKPGKKVQFTVVQSGKEYVVTSIK